MAAVGPSLMLLFRARQVTPVRITGATVAAIAALTWMGECLFDWPNPVAPVIEACARNDVWIFAGLALLGFTVKCGHCLQEPARGNERTADSRIAALQARTDAHATTVTGRK